MLVLCLKGDFMRRVVLNSEQVRYAEVMGTKRDEYAKKIGATNARMEKGADSRWRHIHGLGCEIATAIAFGIEWKGQATRGFKIGSPDLGEFEVRGAGQSFYGVNFNPKRDHQDRKYILADFSHWPRIDLIGWAYGHEILTMGRKMIHKESEPWWSLPRSQLRSIHEAIRMWESPATETAVPLQETLNQ